MPLQSKAFKKSLPPPTKAKHLLTDILDKWYVVAEKTLAARTAPRHKAKINRFIEFVAQHYKFKHIGEVTKASAVAYREHLDKVNAPQTADDAIRTVRGFFQFAIDRDYFQGNNPFANLTVLSKKQKEKISQSYERFTNPELLKIFGYEFQQFKKPDLFFIPLISLYSGARIEEIAQLQITDIIQIDGIWCFDFNNKDNKSLKTQSSRRTVPIHSKILSAGFIPYFEFVKANFQDGKQLFPYLHQSKSGFSKTTGYNFSKYLDNIGVVGGTKVFHSFRHTFNDELKQLGIEESVRCQMTGHTYNSINNSVYSKPHSITQLKEKLEQLTFPLSYLHYDIDSILIYELVEQMKKRTSQGK